jgi:hypothetical protein
MFSDCWCNPISLRIASVAWSYLKYITTTFLLQWIR